MNAAIRRSMVRRAITLTLAVALSATLAITAGAQVRRSTGRSRAPQQEKEPPRNQLGIPASRAPDTDPEPIGDDAFAEAIRAVAPYALVDISLPGERQALGFLIDGPDDEHKLIVTNFLSVAPKGHGDDHRVKARLALDDTELEVVGLHNYSEQYDLALINVKVPEKSKLEVLELAPADPAAGDDVYAVGNWRDRVDWAAAGEVKALAAGHAVGAPAGTEWIETDARLGPSLRGGALLDDRQRVVGLCTSYGRQGRGPYLACPVSQIRKLATPEPFGSGRFPPPRGAFRWSEMNEPDDDGSTYTLSRILTAATAIERALQCRKCEGHGYLVRPVYTTDRSTGQRRQTGEENEVCEVCGGVGTMIRAGLQDLLATIGETLLRPGPRVEESDLAQARAKARENVDHVAVNRLILAEVLTPTANDILSDIEAHHGKPVAFLAEVGRSVRRKDGADYLWVRAYDLNEWIITYGADERTASNPSRLRMRPTTTRGNGRTQRTDYALVIGIVRGYAVFERSRKLYRAPMVEAVDVVNLRHQ